MILAIVQARMSSTRLPGKVLKQILGRPMLARQLDRLRRSTRISKIVLATSNELADDPVAALGVTEGIATFRGSLNDVLARFHGASKANGPAEHIVRLTADCPLCDWRVIDQCIAQHLSSGADYTSNVLERTYPDGLDVEVMRSSVLDRAAREATDQYDHEHVTPYIYRHPELFRIGHLKQPQDHGALRWTVDNSADFDFVVMVFRELILSVPDFGQREILALLKRKPEIAAINGT